jgi:hypothetical protein
MGAVYLHAGFSQNSQYLYFSLPGKAQADSTIGAEVAGNFPDFPGVGPGQPIGIQRDIFQKKAFSYLKPSF